MVAALKSRNITIDYDGEKIDKIIFPLVEVLNNEWTKTTSSCGGHWDPAPGFQYPYVNFTVIGDRAGWQYIQDDLWARIAPVTTGRITIAVDQCFKLPETLITSASWRFRPAISGNEKMARELFKDEFDFRGALDIVMQATCDILKDAMSCERIRKDSGLV